MVVIDPHAGYAVVLGSVSGRASELFLVGLAVLTLLSNAATKRPLLCVIDNAQWVDAESAGSSHHRVVG